MDEVGLTAVAVLLVLAPAIAAVVGYGLGRRRSRATVAPLARERRELAATAERLSRAARLAGIGEFLWNVDTGALWWSDNCYHLYGLDPAVPSTIEQAYGAIHPDDAAAAASATEQLLAGGPPTERHLRIVRPDGSVRYMLSCGELYEQEGQRYVFGVMKDVSDLAEVSRRLERAQSQYRFLFEHNPMPMWVFDVETLTFLAVNDAMLRHYGYAREQLVGRSLLAIRPAEEAEAAREAALAPGSERPQGRVWSHLRHDGSCIRVAIYTHDIEFEGRRARLVAAQDVTERERNEDRFRMIARATSDVVYDFDMGPDRMWWSDSFSTVFGYPQDRAPATLAEWAALVHPDDLDTVNESLDAALASTAEEWNAEYRLRRGDGTYATVNERGLIRRDAGGKPVRMVGGLLDVTAQREFEARLHLLTRAVESADNGIIVTDARRPDLPTVYVNPAFERMTGYPAAEMQGHNPRILQRDDRDQPGIHMIRQCIEKHHDVRTLLRNYRKDGTLFWNEMYISPVRDEAGALTHFVGVLTDVSERHNYEERLAHRATHDELTGLPNRLLLDDRLEHAIHASDRYGWRTTVVFVDLDDFKLLNDSLGHGAGDIALREIAQRLQHVVRGSDTVARFGGDEFVAVLTAPEHEDDPAEVIRRIIDALATPLEVGGVSHTLTASIGYSTYPDDGHTPETLLRQADLAMYQAKRRGRNRAIAYRPEFGTNVSRRLQLVHQLREGLERDEFVLAFQPLFSPDGRVLALEALVRWQHPTRGLLPPGEFISICEQSGLIVELGRRILHVAARHHARLAAAGLGHLRIAVNVSAAQFTDDLYADVEAAVREHALPPGVLELELTESVIMESPTHAIELMQRISALGVSFSVDDFGTGYSSLAYLKRFPIERLKIDRSFVQDLGSDTDDAAICQSIISLAQALDICTVAEGVETEQQRAWLSERGCDELQGFLLARPQPFDVLLPHLRAAATVG